LGCTAPTWLRTWQDPVRIHVLSSPSRRRIYSCALVFRPCRAKTEVLSCEVSCDKICRRAVNLSFHCLLHALMSSSFYSIEVHNSRYNDQQNMCGVITCLTYKSKSTAKASLQPTHIASEPSP